MLQTQLRSSVRYIAAIGFIAVLSLAPGGVRADENKLGMQVLEFIGPGVGGYWFSSGSATTALGTPKFVGNSTFFVKPAHRNGYLVTAGYQDVSIKDHWQPYSGGNRMTLTGAAFKITTEKKDRYSLVPFINGGIFQGHINSEILNMKADKIVPSIAFGVEKEVVRYVKVSAGFRWTGKIKGVDTSGGYVSIGLFP